MFLFVPHLFLASVVAFSLSNRIRVNSLPRNRLGLLCESSDGDRCLPEVHSVSSTLQNPNNHNITAFEDSYSLYLQIMEPNKSDRVGFVKNSAARNALMVLKDALRLFGPDCVIASYNGGKDAVAIMHLLRAALAAYSVEHHVLWRPKLIYFSHKKEFPEIEALVFDTARRYDLELVVFDCGFVEGLKRSVEGAKGKPLAFVLGTRKGDPNSGDQEVFAPSSDWMPPFMRVNPIMSWSYGEVWRFLVDFKLPYCSLYDEGYTSLGNVDNTAKNPSLLQADGRFVYLLAVVLSLCQANSSLLSTWLSLVIFLPAP
jgi:3'-phosphoadenosine 5'-phosphosulfate sulfotransferase (PAPS reductase)/FAD synthetase